MTKFEELNELMNHNPIVQSTKTIMDKLYDESCNIIENLTLKGFEKCGFSRNYIMHYPEEFSVKYEINRTIYYHLEEMIFYIENTLSDDNMSTRWEVKLI